MVQGFFHADPDEILEFDQVHTKSRVRMRLTSDCDVQIVIVSVPIRICTFPESLYVSLIAPVVIPEFVRCVESGASGDVDLFH